MALSSSQDARSDQPTLPSERIAGTILPKVLTTFDMVAIFVGIVLFITNAALMSGAGPAAYGYWVLGFLTFLLPCAFVTGQLGVLFPGEGSIYLWTQKALGPFAGFCAGFCAWFPGILGLVATTAGAIPFIQYLFPEALSHPWQQGLAIVGMIAFSFGLCLLRLRVTQTVINVVFVGYGGAILLLALAGVVALVRGHAASVDYSAQNWWPHPSTFTFYGTVVLGLLGVEVPLNLGVEIKHAHAITRYLVWGSVVIMLAYLLGTFGVMTAVPVTAQGNLSSVAQGIALGFGGSIGHALGVLATIIYISFFLFTTVVFNYSFARLLFVSGLDQQLPTIVSKVNRNKVPWVALLIQSLFASFIAILVFICAPYFLTAHAPGDLATMVYDIIQAVLVVIWCLSLVFLFVDVILIRRKFRDSFARARLAPDWVFFCCAVVGSLASLIGIGVTFTNPWTTLLSTPSWDGWVAVMAASSLAIGGMFYLVRQKRTTSKKSDEEVLAQVVQE